MITFEETPNDVLSVAKVKMNLDGLLSKRDDVPHPLPGKSGFNMVINGPSGSGKTNLLCNVIYKKASNKKRQSLRKLFDHVIVVSPSLGSLTNNIFKDLADNKRYTKFDDKMLDGLEDILETAKEQREENNDNYYTLLILDDVGSQIKKNKRTEGRFSALLQNRRHLGGGGLSVISLTQKHRDMSLAVRNNLTHYITFLPKNEQEKEAIFKEYVSMPRKCMNEFFNYFFGKRYDFLLIDMSIPPFEYYRNYNKVKIIDKNNPTYSNEQTEKKKP